MKGVHTTNIVIKMKTKKLFLGILNISFLKRKPMREHRLLKHLTDLTRAK